METNMFEIAEHSIEDYDKNQNEISRKISDFNEVTAKKSKTAKDAYKEQMKIEMLKHKFYITSAEYRNK